ncbi:MAG: hypothetical protein JG781_1036 [Peptococcaceae bacterium]|jgi:hypothetical protein|nr:hypothetical protein [Peptococcaceae bacterium]
MVMLVLVWLSDIKLPKRPGKSWVLLTLKTKKWSVLRKLQGYLREKQGYRESSVDQKNQQYYTKFDVALEGNKLVGLEIFVDKTKFGFGVPLIYNKYAVVDLKDRDKLKEKLSWGRGGNLFPKLISGD